MIQASDAEVAALRNCHVACENANIAAGGRLVAKREAVAAGSIWQRHRRPHLLDCGVDSDAPGIKIGTGISNALKGHRRRIQVVILSAEKQQSRRMEAVGVFLLIVCELGQLKPS